MPDEVSAAPSFAIMAAMTSFRTAPAPSGQPMPASGAGLPARVGDARIAIDPAVLRA